jgi:hypothetical protein
MAALKASVEAAKSRRSESADAQEASSDEAESVEPARRRRAS